MVFKILCRWYFNYSKIFTSAVATLLQLLNSFNRLLIIEKKYLLITVVRIPTLATFHYIFDTNRFNDSHILQRLKFTHWTTSTTFATTPMLQRTQNLPSDLFLTRRHHLSMSEIYRVLADKMQILPCWKRPLWSGWRRLEKYARLDLNTSIFASATAWNVSLFPRKVTRSRLYRDRYNNFTETSKWWLQTLLLVLSTHFLQKKKKKKDIKFISKFDEFEFISKRWIFSLEAKFRRWRSCKQTIAR